jgi:hypothetical protein
VFLIIEILIGAASFVSLCMIAAQAAVSGD